MTDERPTQAWHIIAKMGGLRAASRVLGHRNVTTVQGWKTRGFIPAHRQLEVLQKARAAGFALSPLDFVIHLTAAADGGDVSDQLSGMGRAA